jgi:hypothetical protein
MNSQHNLVLAEWNLQEITWQNRPTSLNCREEGNLVSCGTAPTGRWALDEYRASTAAAIRVVTCGSAPASGSLVWHGALALAYVP